VEAPSALSGDAPEIRSLIAASREGDREAFGRLVRLHERVVVRVALAAVGVREDAEEVAQDVFVVAWTKLAAFRGDSSFRTWLLAITWRRAMRRRTLRGWWRQRTEPLEPGQFADRDAPSPEGLVLGQERSHHIAAGIRALPRKLRDALLLAASGEHSYEEIAALLGIRVGTLKWRVSEARRRVAQTMKDRGV